MGELAASRAPDRLGAGRWSSLAGGRPAREALPILAVAICAVEVLTTFRYELGQDSWLTLLGGRIVWHGLPHHDWLTVWAHGTAWVDQQWLAQLVFYGAFAAGGLKLALFLNAALATGAFACAVAAARARGASAMRVAMVAVLSIPVVVFGWPLRTQSLAYPLFVAVLWLLARDAVAPSRRVYVVLPLLALWANLHGSVVLAAALVALRGVTFGVGQLHARRHQRQWLTRTTALVVGPGLCIFASPYGLALAGYYRRVLFNPSLTRYVGEWRPTSPQLVTAPFYALAFAAVWLIARSRLTWFERLALLLLIAAALSSVRHVVWFGLAAIVLLPRALEDVWPSSTSSRQSRLGVLAGLCATVAALAFAGAVAARPLSWLTRDWPTGARGVVTREAARDPSLTILSSLRYSDWLLFTEPQLAGRVGFDARLELLSHPQVKRVFQLANAIGDSWTTAGVGKTLFVVDRKNERDLDRALRSEPNMDTLYRDDSIDVLVRGR